MERIIIDKQKMLEGIERKMKTSDDRCQLIQQYTDMEHLDREAVEILIDYILVGKKDPETKEVPVEIYGNF